VRPTVLVVDDDKAIRELLKLHLVNAGYDVLLAEDAVVGGRLLFENGPDLLVLDINIPYLSGTQFVATLIADRTVPPVPVVFITGHEDLFHEALAIGKPCLLKPFYVDQLLSLTDRLLSDAR
jgi:DNA-binding response OmpR family regulator